MSTYLVAFVLGCLAGAYPAYRLGLHRALRHLGSSEYRNRMSTIEKERDRHWSGL